jgi:hypothetical protein
VTPGATGSFAAFFPSPSRTSVRSRPAGVTGSDPPNFLYSSKRLQSTHAILWPDPGAPNTNPPNQNFGRVTEQQGIGRNLQIGVRFEF